ncbi:MAG: hypothetical protein HC800_10600 [Phormidesmis sp. RL_2_1]|nr:hypothetical protein [Phormidesmis sp. RL_2_1]
MNPFKSLFGQSLDPLSQPAEPFSPNSPSYAWTFQSPYQRPRILILVSSAKANSFQAFYNVLKQLHSAESLACFCLESTAIQQWTASRSAAALVEQIIADIQPTIALFIAYDQPHSETLPALFKAQNIATVCHVDESLMATATQAQTGLLASCDLLYAATAPLGDRLSTQFPDRTVFYPQLSGTTTLETQIKELIAMV